MKKDNTYQILENFSKGKYTYRDYLNIKNWFSNIHDFNEVKQFLFEQWNELNKQKDTDEKSLQHIYEKIEYRILLEEKIELKKRKLWNFYRQVAAILLIPVIAFTVLYYLNVNSYRDLNKGWVEINSPKGARTEFSLPDGSKGWLNSGSKLKYQPTFLKTRTVELTGEAYFSVKHNNSVFTVSVVDMDIRVLGTQFNVSAYPQDDFTEVVLATGKVEVKGKNCDLQQMLLPDHKLTFISDDFKYKLQQVDTKLYTAWKEGFLKLDNETLAQAVNRIERWYNVNIIIEDEVLKSYRFKATFQDELLEEVLRLIAITTPIDYEIKKRVMGEDGVYKKKEVRIKLKQ
jgi:transmembrane sensor